MEDTIEWITTQIRSPSRSYIIDEVENEYNQHRYQFRIRDENIGPLFDNWDDAKQYADEYAQQFIKVRLPHDQMGRSNCACCNQDIVDPYEESIPPGMICEDCARMRGGCSTFCKGTTHGFPDRFYRFLVTSRRFQFVWCNVLRLPDDW